MRVSVCADPLYRLPDWVGPTGGMSAGGAAGRTAGGQDREKGDALAALHALGDHAPCLFVSLSLTGPFGGRRRRARREEMDPGAKAGGQGSE